MLLMKKKVQKGIMLKQKKIFVGNLDTTFAIFMKVLGKWVTLHSKEDQGIKFLFHSFIITLASSHEPMAVCYLNIHSLPLGNSQSMSKNYTEDDDYYFMEQIKQSPTKEGKDSWGKRKEWAERFFFKATSLTSRQSRVDSVNT